MEQAAQQQQQVPQVSVLRPDASSPMLSRGSAGSPSITDCSTDLGVVLQKVNKKPGSRPFHGGAHNRPWRFAPRPIWGVGGVAFSDNFSLILVYCSTRSCNHLSLNRGEFARIVGISNFLKKRSIRVIPFSLKCTCQYKITARCGWKIRQNYAQKRDTCGAQN